MNPENNSGNFLEKLAGRLSNIVLLGFFGFLFSLPIVTLGAAYVAENAAMKDYLVYDNQKPLKLFFSEFKRNFALSTKVWLIELIAGLVLVYDFIYYRTGFATVDILGQTGCFVLLILLVFTLPFSFVVINEELADKPFAVLKEALTISFNSFLRSLCLVFIWVASIIAVIVLFRGMIVILPGIQVYLSYQFVPQILKDSKFKRGNARYQISQRKKK